MSIDSMLNPLDSTPGTPGTPETPSGDGSGSTSVSEKDTTKLGNYLDTKQGDTIASTGISKYKQPNPEYSMNLKRIFANVKSENPGLFKSRPGQTQITEKLIRDIKSLNKDYVGWPNNI